MPKFKYFIGCMALASLLVSCEKKETYDITGDPDVKFFTNNPSSGNLPDNAVGYSAVNIPNVAGAGVVNLSHTLPAIIKFPVFASKPVSQNVMIGAQLDNSLIAAYNTEKNTSYVPFPAGILNTESLGAQIISGATASMDSISIATDLTKLNLLSDVAYMAPIKLTSVSNPAVGKVSANSTVGVTYVVVNVEQRRIKYLATAAEAQGALITPRTPWAVTFTPAPAPATSGSIVDGSTTTYSRWTASPVQVDVNLQAVKNVTGIRLYTSNSATYTPTQVKVSVSNDGLTYDVIGTPLKANLTYASSYNYILFYKPISAKYIRLELTYSTSTNSQNFRITELDVYAN